MNNNNFLVARLCDNDFGSTIKDAIEHGIKYWGLDNTLPIEKWKKFILIYVEANHRQRNLIRDWQEDDTWNIQSTIKHLNERMDVTYENNAPTDDHDGGSAAYDFNRNYLYTY